MYRVKQRGEFYFVVEDGKQIELAPVFDYEVTAKEICEKVNNKYPFFGQIPTVPAGSPYPRIDINYPRPFPRKVSLL